MVAHCNKPVDLSSEPAHAREHLHVCTWPSSLVHSVERLAVLQWKQARLITRRYLFWCEYLVPRGHTCAPTWPPYLWHAKHLCRAAWLCNFSNYVSPVEGLSFVLVGYFVLLLLNTERRTCRACRHTSAKHAPIPANPYLWPTYACLCNLPTAYLCSYLNAHMAYQAHTMAYLPFLPVS